MDTNTNTSFISIASDDDVDDAPSPLNPSRNDTHMMIGKMQAHLTEHAINDALFYDLPCILDNSFTLDIKESLTPFHILGYNLIHRSITSKLIYTETRLFMLYTVAILQHCTRRSNHISQYNII